MLYKAILKKSVSRSILIVVLVLVSLSGVRAAERNAETKSPAFELVEFEPYSGFTKGRHGVVNCMLKDSHNSVWIGTDGDGVVCIGQYSSKPQCFKKADGLGDDFVYALAEDKWGRIWVGHRNHGVSVYNGAKWCNFGIEAGPLSERIFDMAVSPRDGSVWIAGNAGLACYHSGKRKQSADKPGSKVVIGSHIDGISIQKVSISSNGRSIYRNGIVPARRGGKWVYYDTSNGLPGNHINTITIAQDGTIYAGSLCDGIFIGRPDSAGKIKWKVVQARGSVYDRMFKPTGEGLPCDQINDILLAGDGRVYAATQEGLGIRERSGRWHYIRGQNLRAMVNGLYAAPGSKLKKRKDAFLEARGRWSKIVKRLPLNDGINALADAGDGLVWLGYRGNGAALFDAYGRGELWHTPRSIRNGVIKTILPDVGGHPLLGAYQRGVFEFVPAVQDNAVPLPEPALKPGRQELGEMLTALTDELGQGKAKGAGEYPYAAYLGDDWSTLGDWVGIYGSDAAELCGFEGYSSRHYGMRSFDCKSAYSVSRWGGPLDAGAVRLWTHWRKSSERRVLYGPELGYRKQTEINDYGTGRYSWLLDGPDLWLRIGLKEGMHRVSFYFINPNGHSWPPSMRDYMVEVRKMCLLKRKKDPNDHKYPAPFDWSKQLAEPVLAHARVSCFYGGVYKTFLMKGPGEYAVKIDRNHGHIAILSGLFIDKVSTDGTLIPWHTSAEIGSPGYEPPLVEIPPYAGLHLPVIKTIWQMLDTHAASSVYVNARRHILIMLYRSLQNVRGGETLRENIRRQIPLMTAEDRARYDKNMEEDRAYWDKIRNRKKNKNGKKTEPSDGKLSVTFTIIPKNPYKNGCRKAKPQKNERTVWW
jgi:hypothetical protein